MCHRSRLSLWMLLFSGVGVCRLLIYSRSQWLFFFASMSSEIHHLIPVHRSVRRDHHPRVSAIKRAHSSNGSSSQSHWESRTQREVRKGIGDAGETKLGHLLLFVISIAQPHAHAS